MAFLCGIQLTATTTTHFQNVQDAYAFLNVKDFLTLRGPTDRTRWNTYPSIVNAFYEPQLNSISQYSPPGSWFINYRICMLKSLFFCFPLNSFPGRYLAASFLRFGTLGVSTNLNYSDCLIMISALILRYPTPN